MKIRKKENAQSGSSFIVANVTNLQHFVEPGLRIKDIDLAVGTY